MKITKNNQFGRSMVEMLGVLPIIGVLSIGGIAGYSKAMFKYKMNKTMDIISHAIARIVELDSMKWREDDIIETPQDMVKYGIFPDCEEFVHEGEATGFCILPDGNFFAAGLSQSGCSIIYYTTFDSCVAFLNSKIYNIHIPKDWWDEGYILLNNEIIIGKGDDFISYGIKPELTATDVLDVCDRHCKDKDYDNMCAFIWNMKVN